MRQNRLYASPPLGYDVPMTRRSGVARILVRTVLGFWAIGCSTADNAVALVDAGADLVADAGAQPSAETTADLAVKDAIPDRSCPSSTLTLLPPQPTVTDALQVIVPGADSADAVVGWFLVNAGGSPVQIGTGKTLAPGKAKKHDTVRVTLVYFAALACAPLSADVTLSDTPPSVTKVLVLPTVATAGQVLTCSVSDAAWSDPDVGDAHLPAYAWLNNGVPIADASSATLDHGFKKHDQLLCEVTPSDGELSGEPVKSAIVAIGNSTPETVSIELACPTGSAPMHCKANGTDPDGGNIGFVFEWRSGPGDCSSGALLESTGSPKAGATGDTLSQSPAKGSVVFCCATPMDDEGLAGTSTQSSSCTVPNHPPTVSPAIVSALGEPVPTRFSSLICGATVSDPDGDIAGRFAGFAAGLAKRLGLQGFQTQP